MLRARQKLPKILKFFKVLGLKPGKKNLLNVKNTFSLCQGCLNAVQKHSGFAVIQFELLLTRPMMHNWYFVPRPFPF